MPIDATEMRIRFKRHFPSAQNSLIDEFLLKALRDIATDFPLLADEIAGPNLIARQGEYGLKLDTATVFRIEHQNSADDVQNLDFILWEDLESRHENWRTWEPSRPQYVAYRAGKIILAPAPVAATNGNYPRIWIARTKIPTNLTQFPEELPDDYGIVYRGLKLYAHIHAPYRVPEFQEAINEQNTRLERWTTGRMSDECPRIEPFRKRTRVR